MSLKKTRRKARRVRVSFRASNGEKITFWKRGPVPKHIKVIFYARKKQKESLRKNQSGIIYIFVTIIVFLFFMAFVWFAAYAIINPIHEAIMPIATSYHTESWPLFTQLGFAVTFMANFWQYLLALAFFGLVLWTYMYSQHRGQPY